MVRIKQWIVIIICIVLSGAGFWYVRRIIPVIEAPAPSPTDVIQNRVGESAVDDVRDQSTSDQTPVSSEKNSPESPTPEAAPVKSVLQSVPFISQAPFGEWDNPTFQDGCEEASMIMTMAWVQGAALTPESGKSSIENITQFETKKFGTFVSDTSAEDTAQIMRDYYYYEQVSVLHDASIDAIKSLLVEGALVMAPMNGQALNNPNFTQPGPLHHMLVIIGYDMKTREFVTNDPGTRKGEGYRYSEDVLYQAIRDYPTNNSDQPITDNQKTIIVVKK